MESSLCDRMRLIYFEDICSRLIYVEDIYQYTVVVFTFDSAKGCDTVVAQCSGGENCIWVVTIPRAKNRKGLSSSLRDE
jgi:hypothetical protein